METLYNMTINAVEKLLPLSAFFNDKMKLFTEGRKTVFPILEHNINPADKTIWIHAASLGEYEQAVPIIEGLKQEFPNHKIVITFFSPSGYEIKKNTGLADVVTYLPLDTRKNVRKFLDLIHPEMALMIKYEFWPNLLWELKQRNIRTFLVSGSFRKDQPFFTSYGKWMQKYLHSFDHFFVQNQNSKDLLNTIGFENVSISGDTRFDRVSRQIEQDNTLPFIADFKANQLCVVAGSTWPEDEELLIDFINSAENVKFIIAPHTIKPERIHQLKQKLSESVLYSEMENKDLSTFKVFIIDTIGLLTKIYNYADVAYVGGAAGTTGLHNILEPATFGVPIVIGQNYSKFPEAKQLRKLAGLFSVTTKKDLKEILEKLLQERSFREKTGLITGHFVESNTGATKLILDHILKKA